MSVIKPHRYLSKEGIETQANDLLLRMQGTPNYPKWPYVADRAVNFLDLGVVLVSIPPHNGRPVFARIYPQKRLIEINEDIPKLKEDRGLEQSTLAHEIGHWMLHVNQDEADGFLEQLELPLGSDFTEEPFLCRSVSEQQIYQINANKQLESREWQAQYFASCLLMPRHILEEKRKGRDLTNWRHLYAMRSDLGVTISNLKHRLQDLGWINLSKDSQQIYLGKTPPNGQTSLFG